MRAELCKLGDFNEVINYYQQMISLAENITPTNISFSNDKKSFPELAYYRALINNIGISIAQNFDILEKNIPESDINDIILYELENGGQQIKEGTNFFKFLEEPFKKIMKENKLTPFETLKQIRNSLLHGNYYLEINDETQDRKKVKVINFENENEVLMLSPYKVIVHMKSKSMTGKLDYKIACNVLEYFYDTLRDSYVNDKKIFNTVDRKFLSCKNVHFLQAFLDSYTPYKIQCTKSDTDDNTDITLKQYPFLEKFIKSQSYVGNNHFEISELSEEEIAQRKEFLKNYINYIGKDRWKNIEKLPYYYQNLIFENILVRSSLNNFSNVTDLNNTFCRAIYEAKIDSITGEELNNYSKETFLTLGFEAPIIYANMLLGMVNYAGLYLKEQNNTDSFSLFEYHNLDGFDGVDILIDTCPQKSIQKNLSGKEKQDKYDNYIENCQQQLQSLNSKINKIRKNQKKLNDKNPKKNELEEEYNKNLEECLQKKEIVANKIEQIKKRKEDYENDYADYSEFFRHLRNSIAHGNYEINYNEALKKKNLSKIEFAFYDYPEGELQEPEFKVKLTANKLLKIIRGVQTKVNEQLINESQIEKIVKTNIFEFYDEESIESKGNEILRTSRPKETGLSPDRIEEGINSIDIKELECEKKEKQIQGK